MRINRYEELLGLYISIQTKWKKSWKLRLIGEHNSNWNDLYEGML